MCSLLTDPRRDLVRETFIAGGPAERSAGPLARVAGQPSPPTTELISNPTTFILSPRSFWRPHEASSSCSPFSPQVLYLSSSFLCSLQNSHLIPMKLSSFLLPSLLRATFFLHRSMRGRAKGRTTVMQARAPAALPWCATAETGAGWGSDAGNGTPRCWNRPTEKLQPASVDAGTSNHFCYHRRLVLLEPPPNL
ncbi:hypothetical protein VPH35_119125 [Triticum aestivum]